MTVHAKGDERGEHAVRLQAHLVGPRPWRPYAKAKYLHDLKYGQHMAIEDTRLVLAHYEVARKEEERMQVWLRTRRVAIIMDEAAKIKNPESALTMVYHRLAPNFARRVIMTGTPVANRPYPCGPCRLRRTWPATC